MSFDIIAFSINLLPYFLSGLRRAICPPCRNIIRLTASNAHRKNQPVKYLDVSYGILLVRRIATTTSCARPVALVSDPIIRKTANLALTGNYLFTIALRAGLDIALRMGRLDVISGYYSVRSCCRMLLGRVLPQFLVFGQIAKRNGLCFGCC